MTGPENDHPQLGRIEQRCFACRYDLHGSNSTACPECGTARLMRIDFSALDQFNLAQTALGGRDLLRRVLASAGGAEVTNLITGRERSGGALWIDVTAQDEAMALLQEAGVHQLGLVLPIVDRAEPECPKCGRAVDPEGPPQCPHCAAAFEWVSIEDPDVSVIDRTCRACGHELLGQKSDRCPKCGELLPVDLDAMVQAALSSEGHEEEAGPEDGADEPDRARQLGYVVIVIMVVVVAIILLTIASS